jgi:molybdate transport system substrate-binding protein
MLRRLAVSMIAALMMAGAVAAAQPARAETVEVFAAASLKETIDEAAKAYEAKTGVKVRATYASSAQLAKQIQQGAPADDFISADSDWMDWALGYNLVDKHSRRDVATNRLVLIAPLDSKLRPFALRKGVSLARLLGGGRLAVGETKSVPAGIYALASLKSLGMWPQVQDHLAQAENVRAALAFVARGEAPLGIVYATDAQAEPKVKVLSTFPESSHAPIVYPAAVVRESKHAPAAAAFLTFLSGPQGQAILRRHGFGPPRG